MPGLLQQLKKASRPLFYLPVVKPVFMGLPVLRQIYPAVERPHPFDKRFKVDTNGFVAREKIHADPAVNKLINHYTASQASVIRTAIATLGDISDYSFVDFGCGKGRATLVASEFPFRENIGVELSADLANTARRNAATFARRFADRPKITIHNQNVLDFQFPKGKLVLYMYNAFGPELTAAVVKKVEASLASTHTSHAFVIYYNPVFPESLEESPVFSRWFAKTLPYAAEEIGFGPDAVDTVVIWQSRGTIHSPHPEANQPIVPVHAGLKAGLAG